MPRRKVRSKITRTENCPKYAERELRIIVRFMAGLTLDMMYAIDGLIEFYGNDLNTQLAKNHIDGYSRGIDAYRYAVIRSVHRQRHLVEMDETEFQRIIRIWKLPMKTLSELGQLGIYANTSTASEEKNVNGQMLENTPNENGGTQPTRT